MKADATLDCLGLYCPMPIMRTKEKIDALEPGRVLEVLADDQGVEADMNAWCRRTGNELLCTEEGRPDQSAGAEGRAVRLRR